VNYRTFRDWFQEKQKALELPSDCTETHEPVLLETSRVNFTFNWELEFTDGTYIRLQEHYSKAKAGGAARISFAFHYGPITGRNPDGTVKYVNTDPVHIRMDTNPSPAHLHYGGWQPHIPQSNVDGITLNLVDMFDFLVRIFEHRATGKDISDVFGFQIRT
jgi:hypothetical protein